MGAGARLEVRGESRQEQGPDWGARGLTPGVPLSGMGYQT